MSEMTEDDKAKIVAKFVINDALREFLAKHPDSAEELKGIAWGLVQKKAHPDVAGVVEKYVNATIDQWAAG